MADEHPLDGFNQADLRHGDERTVTVADGILALEIADRSGYTTAYTTRHYRLVEVEMQWVEVDPA